MKFNKKLKTPIFPVHFDISKKKKIRREKSGGDFLLKTSFIFLFMWSSLWNLMNELFIVFNVFVKSLCLETQES